MLAVASDRFPSTGAVAISIMGGIGMMSAGLLGGPGLGYAKDRFAAESLKVSNAKAYDEFKSASDSGFLFLDKVKGIDGKKLGEIAKKSEEKKELTKAEKEVQLASIEGDRKTLKADSYIPATMAAIYLLLLLYFKSIGGYRAVHIDGSAKNGAH